MPFSVLFQIKSDFYPNTFYFGVFHEPKGPKRPAMVKKVYAKLYSPKATLLKRRYSFKPQLRFPDFSAESTRGSIGSTEPYKPCVIETNPMDRWPRLEPNLVPRGQEI